MEQLCRCLETRLELKCVSWQARVISYHVSYQSCHICSVLEILLRYQTQPNNAKLRTKSTYTQQARRIAPSVPF